MAFGTLTRQARGLIPAERSERRYVLTCLVNFAGTGLFLSGTVIFAIRVMRLSPQQISLGYSAAGLAALLTSGSVGSLVDRFGTKRVILIASSLQGIVDLGYCVLRSFPAFILLTCLTEALMASISVGMTAYASSLATGPERIRLRAQTRSMGNAGFGVGALLAALVLAIGTTPVLYLLPAGDSASCFALVALAISLPKGQGAAGKTPEQRPLPARRNLPFLIGAGLNSVLRMHESLILIVLPLWIVTRTSVPHPLLGLFLVMNTAGCVLFQVRASAGTENLAGSVRKIRLSAVVMLPACVLFALSGSAPAALAILVMTAGYAVLTATELFQGSGGWGMMYALTPPGAQGDYIGVYGMSGAVQQILGPAIGTWLVVRYGTAGWLTLAVMVLLAASLIGLVARWAARMMEQRQGGIPADVALAGLGDSERD